jgi:hypothetical protein
MRALLLSVGLFVANLAFQISLAKYADKCPDWLVVCLWILPILPLGWWVWTHDFVLKRREWISRKFKEKHFVTLVAGALGIVLVLASLGGAAIKVITIVTRPDLNVAVVGSWIGNVPHVYPAASVVLWLTVKNIGPPSTTSD